MSLMKVLPISGRILVASVFLFAVYAFFVFAQDPTSGKSVYDQIKAFQLSGGKAEVANLVLKRDRVAMTFTGTFYFASPVMGRTTGAVFIGKGTVAAGVPPSEFERGNLKRLLKTDAFTADFTSAVLKFSDDTFDVIGKTRMEAAATPEVQKIGSALGPRVLEESGANMDSRLAMSLLNGEKPGFFFANFDGGSSGRFSYLLDAQGRIPTANFSVNGGEKGLIYAYKNSFGGNEVWMAFYGEDDYARGIVAYSDVNDLVDTQHYRIELDLRSPKSKIGLRTGIKMQARGDGAAAIPFSIGESLS